MKRLVDLLLKVLARGGSVRVWCVLAVALSGALVVASSGVAAPIGAAPQSGHRPVALWVGDSYSAGAGSTDPAKYAESFAVSRAFGWRLRLDAIGGTGFVAPSQYGPPIPTRLAADEAHKRKPDIVVIDGGRNDHGSLAKETPAVTSYFDGVERAFPYAQVVVIAPFIMRSKSGDYAATRCLLESQATARGWSYVDPLAQGWIGAVSASLVAPDGVHPDDAGYRYLTRHMVPAILNALLLPDLGPGACLQGGT